MIHAAQMQLPIDAVQKRSRNWWLTGWAIAFCSIGANRVSAVAMTDALPDPLTLSAVVERAADRRSEVTAAIARAAAAGERPAIVSALEDPMVMGGIDHYPYQMMRPEPDPMDPMAGQTTERRFEWSVAIEQRFPLSRIRSQRRRGAEAEWGQRRAEADQVVLDVASQAGEAFFMLWEVRRMLDVTERQIGLAEQMVGATANRLATALGGQSDVLRAEVELARLKGERDGLVGKVGEMQAMLNASMGRTPQLPVPELVASVNTDLPPPVSEVLARAYASRPELRVGAAEIERAEAEVAAMKSMYRPMALVRAGQASTMAEGKGAMLMIGVSVPIWRSRLRAGVSEARAMESMAHADLDAMRTMVAAEAVGARQAVVAARGRLVAYRTDVIPRSERVLEPTLAAYASGNGTLVSILDALQQQWRAQAELVMAETALGRAWVRLHRAVGVAPAAARTP